jgi:Zn-dependent peptidase ImmA (M78 family)
VLRGALGGGADDRMPPLMEMFENARRNVPEAAGLELVVRSDAAMADALAFAVPEEQEIHIASAFADEALRDSPEARFYGIHELNHIIFHSGAPRFFRKSDGNVVYAFLHDQHETTEWQADRIARATFMPRGMVDSCTDALHLAKAAGVPFRHAALRIKELQDGKARSTPSDIALKIAALVCEASRDEPSSSRRQAEVLKLRLWNALPTIDGENGSLSRRCGIYRILWKEFGKTTGCGWFIDGGQITSFFASCSGR